MEIKIVPLSEVKPYYNNPRDNSLAVNPTKESISRYGFKKPIICDRDGVIICGHTRYIAAFQLGMTKVPVVYSDMDSEKAKHFRIADNKLAEKSAYDEEKLLEELRNLEVPESMQAFFFEDIKEMLNFDFNKFDVTPNPADYVTDDQFATGTFQNEGEEEMEGDNQSLPQEGAEQTPETPQQVEYFDTYKPFQKDGKTYMRVFCPYCQNIETIEIK